MSILIFKKCTKCLPIWERERERERERAKLILFVRVRKCVKKFSTLISKFGSY